MLQTASPFYDVYGTADGKYISVGAIEPQFYAAFMAGLGLDTKDLPRQFDRRHWADIKARGGSHGAGRRTGSTPTADHAGP